MMCGITGWIDYTKDLRTEEKIIHAMTSKLRHRGPDAEGFYKGQHALLGHM